MWYYGQEEVDLNRLARTVLHMLLSTMFCYFQRERMGGIQKFQSVVLNLENKGRMQDKEMGGNGLAHKWFLIYATVEYVLHGLLFHLFFLSLLSSD